MSKYKAKNAHAFSMMKNLSINIREQERVFMKDILKQFIKLLRSDVRNMDIRNYGNLIKMLGEAIENRSIALGVPFSTSRSSEEVDSIEEFFNSIGFGEYEEPTPENTVIEKTDTPEDIRKKMKKFSKKQLIGFVKNQVGVRLDGRLSLSALRKEAEKIFC